MKPPAAPTFWQGTVVDDEACIVEFLALFLVDEGLTVLTAGSGREALVIALAEHPDLVLTDVMMPRMSGVELCRLLRGDPATSAMVVLLMSAAVVIDPSGCGSNGVIPKPFDLDVLSETVHRYLRAA